MSGLVSNSRVVSWLGYLAITLLLVLPLSVLTVRSGAWQEGLLLYALACAGSALLVLLSGVLLLVPRYRPFRGQILSRCLFSLPGVLLLFSLAGNQGDVPPIHDITTDVADPPTFEQALVLRGDDANPIDLDADTINQQLAAYPNVKTLRSELSLEDAFQRAQQLAEKMGWEITRSDLNAGVIEAVETTRIMGFKDDVVIRVRTDADGTLVDLRSVSRVGVSDLGANAARIEDFLNRFPTAG
jgi:uncharacterized protein (DUF1499 family)